MKEYTFRITFEFQSAPLTEARGDVSGSAREFMLQMFQSAPLTEARGDPRDHRI